MAGASLLRRQPECACEAQQKSAVFPYREKRKRCAQNISAAGQIETAAEGNNQKQKWAIQKKNSKYLKKYTKAKTQSDRET